MPKHKEFSEYSEFPAMRDAPQLKHSALLGSLNGLSDL